MTKQETITLDLDVHVRDYLDKIAKMSGCTLDQVVSVILAMELIKDESNTI